MLLRPSVDDDIEHGSAGARVRRPEPNEAPAVADPAREAGGLRRGRGVQPDLRDVVRVADLGRAVPPARRDLHDVELVRVLAHQVRRCSVDIAREPEAAHQIAAGFGRHDGEHRRVHDRPAVAEHPVHDVLHGAVVTHGGQVPVAFVERRGRETRDVPGCLRDLDPVLETTVREGALDRTDLGRHPALPRRRIDDDGERTERAGDGAHGGHRSYTPV